MDINEIDLAAKREIKNERFRAAVEARKQQLRTARPWWHRLFPFTIEIKRR